MQVWGKKDSTYPEGEPRALSGSIILKTCAFKWST